MSITTTLNEVLVRLFHDITTIEERAVKSGEYKELTVNDMHVIEAIGIREVKNMTTVARALKVTTGTLTISVNGLVKKGFVKRVRSEEDRRVVLISLTEKGKNAFDRHEQFHQKMIDSVIKDLNDEEQVILENALRNLNFFFRGLAKQECGLTKQERGLTKQERGLTKQGRGMTKQERGLTKQERGLTKQERGLTKQERGMTKQERGLAE